MGPKEKGEARRDPDRMVGRQVVAWGASLVRKNLGWKTPPVTRWAGKELAKLGSNGKVDITVDTDECSVAVSGKDSMQPYLEKAKEARRSARSKVRISAKYVSDSLVVDGVVTDVSADG